jgi:hypothetical protein
MTKENRVRILLAAAPDSAAPIAVALGASEEFHLNVVENLTQAKRQLEQPCSLIVCGLDFDDSRMFDLLRYVKADEHARRIPFLAIKATGHELTPTLQQGIEIACAALGADKFAEVTQWENSYGTEEAHRRLRALVKRLLDI